MVMLVAIITNVIVNLEKMPSKIYPVNTDKPHRCEGCWRVSEECHKDGKAIPGKIYKCDFCGRRWRLNLEKSEERQ